MESLKAFLAYYGIMEVPTSGIVSIHERQIKLVLDEHKCLFVPISGDSQITILVDELEDVLHSQFTCFKPLLGIHDSLFKDNVQCIKADDKAVRLSLCFPGDYIVIKRPVFFRGAGIQKSITIRLVV